MKVKDVMTSGVDVIHPGAMLAEASRRMRDEGVGALPVGQDDRLIGMVTDRDIVCRAVAEGKDPGQTPVSEAMSDKVLYCFDDQSTEEVSANMGENQVRRLPVVNRDKRLVGIVSLGDLSSRGATREAGGALGEISEPSR
ncbi:MAG TPA: CBS domain-containing protein [Kiloniellaceae bacterium]|nr:CBS domain-containing protein [Kiloniellaceae bacterium]